MPSRKKIHLFRRIFKSRKRKMVIKIQFAPLPDWIIFPFLKNLHSVYICSGRGIAPTRKTKHLTVISLPYTYRSNRYFKSLIMMSKDDKASNKTDTSSDRHTDLPVWFLHIPLLPIYFGIHVSKFILKQINHSAISIFIIIEVPKTTKITRNYYVICSWISQA